MFFVSSLQLKFHRRRAAVDKYVLLYNQMHPSRDFFNFVWYDACPGKPPQKEVKLHRRKGQSYAVDKAPLQDGIC